MEKTKSYQIRLRGCDDYTEITRPLTPYEFNLLNQVAEQLNEASDYGCQPSIDIIEDDDND